MRPLYWIVAILLSQSAVAGDAELPESTENFIALLEFVAGWEQHDGEWVDAMSLEQSGQVESQTDDEEQTDE